MKLKVLKTEYLASKAEQTATTGFIPSIKLVKKISFAILQSTGSYLETDQTVTGLTASNGSQTDKITISWNSVPDIDGYRLYRNKELLTQLSGTTYNDTTVTPGTLYEYSVKTFVYNPSDGITYTSKSIYTQGWRKLSVPTLVATSFPDLKTIVLDWTTVPGATEYKLYKVLGTNVSNLAVFGVTYSNRLSDTRIQLENFYTYAVKASCPLGTSEFSQFIGVAIIGNPPAAPAGVTATQAVYTDKIRVSWTGVSDALYYNVYRDSLNNRIKTRIFGTTFDDISAQPNQSYIYAVTANTNKESSATYSGAGWRKITPPSVVSASDGTFTDKIRVTWSSVLSGVTYDLYRGAPAPLSLYQTNLTGITFDDTSVNYGQVYTYGVRTNDNYSTSELSSSNTGYISQSVPDTIPTGFTASDGLYTDKIQVLWNPVSFSQGVSGYKLYRNDILLTTTTSTQYNDTDVDPGITYEYGVLAYNSAGNSGITTDTGWEKLVTPSTILASTNYPDKVVINWTAVNGATAYKIYKGPSVGFLGITTDTQFIDYSVVYGTGYTYSVKSSCALGDSEPTSIVSGSVIQSAPESAPTGISASDGAYTDKISIEWNPVTTIQGISGYKLYRDGSLRDDITETTYNDTTANYGISTEYTVTAYNAAGESPVSSGNTGWINLSKPLNFSASKAQFTDKIRLDWSSVIGAVSYEVYKGTPLSLAKIADTSVSRYTDEGLNEGVTFAYATKAVGIIGISEFSDIDIGRTDITIIPVPNPPTGINATSGTLDSGVNLTWGVVNGISGYVVYRDNQEIQRTITQQYSDTTITPGVLSEYTVAARNVSGIGEPGITTTGWRGLTAPTVFSASKNLADRVVLSWNSSAGATAYKLYTGRSFRPEIDISLVGITESNILSDFTPTFGVGYTYAIKASCALGDSDYANVFPRGSVVQSPPEAAPTGLTATQGTQINQSTVTWNPVTTIQGVSGYKLYKDGAFGGNISSPYIETSLAGVTREFKISAYNKAGQGPLSSGVIGWGKLPPVFGVFASEAEFTDKVNIYWLGAGVPLNTSVVIYGAPNRPSESLQELGRVLVGGDEVFTHTGPTYGTVYKYAVRYSNPVSDGDLSDEFIGYVLQSPPDVVPVISLASNNDAGAVLLEWDVSPTIMGISGYNVYKYDSDLQIKTDVITNPSQQNYIDFDGINGVTYEYKVSAFNLAGEGQLSVGAVGAKAFNPTTLEATKGITTESVGLQWGEISGQNVSYRINRGTSTQTPETIHTTTDLLYTDISASPGVTYEYTVNGFNVAVEGILSNIEIGYRGLTAPVGVTCSNGVYTDRVEISWLPVQGAPQYRVYKGSSFVLLGTTSGITFSDTSIDTIGVTKEYYVSSHIPDVAHESVKSLQTTGWRKLLPPTGMSADKGKLTTGVRITWESAVGATGYKIYKTTDMDPVKETLELLGQTTNTSFTDTNAAADKSFKYYSVKSSCALGDSEYGELDYGYTENLPYTEVISIVPEIYGRYKESVYTAGGLTYISSSPRLIPWSGPLFWNPLTAKEVFEGITAIKGQVTNFGVTYGSNMYDNYVQALYNIGLRGGDSIKNALGSTSSQPVEQRIIKYDSGPWWTDLNGTLGITLRGGTSTRYIRPKTLNELTTKPPPGYRVDALNWINPRNKLLTHLSLISQNILGGNDNVYSNLVWFAGAWRFSLQALTGVTVDKADFPTVYKTDLDARIQSQDYLNVIKTILTEVKNHYPLALPQNGLQDPAKGNAGVNETRTWIGNDLIGSGVSTTQYKGMSGGFRIPSPVIGSATDLDVWSNTTVNTLSPAGLTADQGDYLYDAWNRRYLLNTLYLLEGITTARNPEGISGGQKLSDTASWNSLLTDLRTLLFKELRDHVKQVWERRAWYMVAGSANTGRDYEFNGDVDNWGWVHTNQWMDPLTAIISISMYLYPFAQTSTERQALLSAYNIGSEILAALIERATYSCTSCEDAGIWPEGYGYANQSYPPVLNILDDMKRMGDRRLWDTVSKRGTGISYSCWINNAWKWMQSRIMPNCCIINSGSCDSADYSGGLGNGYHRRAWPMEHAAVLASEYPNPYSKGSALSVYYNRITTTSGLQMMSGQSVFYNRLRLYYETVKNNIPYLDYAKGHYFPDDQTFTWTSQFVDPGLQDDRTNRAYNMNTRTSYTLQAKPFIFGIWGKGSAHFEGKGHRDEGHVSAYMGDAPILLELGEIRADDSITRQYLEKEDGGHNRMQLGGFKKFNWARPAKISGVVLGKTGGSIFMDTTESYNMRSLTAAPSLFNYSWSGPNDYVNIYGTTRVPWGYGPNNSIDEYLYQIAKVTRGISWSYEPYNKVSSYIKITDYMGISGISSGASGPTDRTYYRFHTGASGSTLDTSIGITYAPVSPDKRTWTAGWTAAVKNVITGGYTCDYVGVTMTFSADQPIQIRNRVSAHRSTRDAHNTSPTYGVVGSMANSAVMSPFQLQTLDISLATGFTDERKLNLITEINSTVFRNNTPIVIPTESPLIQNYANYTLGATLSIGNTFGCLTQFKTPCHIFPAWDPEISGYSGISFGRILIDDFSILAAKNGFTLPNALWPSCP